MELIIAKMVHENDEFEMQLGTNCFLKHVPALKARGVRIGAYAYLKCGDIIDVFAFMTIDEIKNNLTDKIVHNKPAFKDQIILLNDNASRRIVADRLQNAIGLSKCLAHDLEYQGVENVKT